MICVDASVAAKWVLSEEHSALSQALFSASMRANDPIIAPLLLPFEVANIIRKQMTRHALPFVDADRLLARFLAYPVTLRSTPDLHRQALILADAHQLPAVYDAHYLALAQHFGCDLWTDDQRLLRAVGGVLPFVRWIGDYAPGTP